MYAVASACDDAKAQLWGLLVVASVDPRLGPEKRTDEGKLVDVEARQLGGFAVKTPWRRGAG